MAVAGQPDGRYSDEENLHDLWRRAEEIRRCLEARKQRLVVVVSHGGILKVWLAHLMFSFMPSGPRVATSAPDAGAEYLGREDNRS
jgi:broad specificity phosphatase PhoE